MGLIEAFLEILTRPTIGEIVTEMIMFWGPVWVAFFVGVFVGWAWKPGCVSLGNWRFDGFSSSSSTLIPSPVERNFGSAQSFDSFIRARTPSFGSCSVDSGVDKEQFSLPLVEKPASSSSHCKKEEGLVVVEDDFKHLCHLVERKDSGPPWKHVMDRSNPRMTYQAWQRDHETGPPQYCSRTVYEDATPELLRDFFWDDEFRLKWDDMLIHAETIEECPTTGTNIVHWIRKFPSAVTENTRLAVEYGNQEEHIIA